ncbi:uncharacterized protein LOC120357935 [Solenopsis invicta]|uniref:uncharacterized protein LOC120357935 n=1 Tax=Solenopsis invicta TaxID=13686 RepID=UPI00193D62F5|nr:uncharacterized protein LOC120357935 [Solenopsis invicta]
MGRGMRRKRLINPFSSDDDSSGSDRSKRCKQDKLKSKLPAAPLPPPLPANSSRRKSLNIALKENINPLIVVSNKKQGKTVTAPTSASTTANVKQNRLLQKIINLRQQAADKAEQRKKAMSLENIHKLPVKKKLVYSTLCSEPLEEDFETNESCKSDSQSSSIVSLNMQSIGESSLVNDMFKDTQSRSFYQSSSNKIQSLIQTQRLCSSSIISDIHQKSSKELNEFDTEEKDETDSLTLSQTNLNIGLVLYIIYYV